MSRRYSRFVLGRRLVGAGGLLLAAGSTRLHRLSSQLPGPATLRPLVLAGCVAALLVASTHRAAAGNTWDGGDTGNYLWSSASNWSDDTLPGYGTISFSGTSGTTNTIDINFSMNQLNWNGASAWTLESSGGAVLSLYDNGGIQAKIESLGTGGVTINAPIVFAATNATSSFKYGEINAISSNITFGSAGTLTVNGSEVNGIRMFGGGNTTTFNNTVSASGKYFSTSAVATSVVIGGSFTSGDFYLMNNGTLTLASGGSFSPTALRLGGDFGTTTTQDLARGATFILGGAAGGQTFGGTINSVASNTSGALVVSSPNTSGVNTLSGPIYLDSTLRFQNAAGGNLSLTGPTDVKSQQIVFAPAGTITVSGNLISSNAAGGTLLVNGTGTLILSNTSNTYTGTNSGSLNATGTQISGGATLGIYGDGSLGLAPAGQYNNIQFIGNGTLQDTANNITLSATRNISLATGVNATIDTLGNTMTIGGVINSAASTGNLLKAGSGTLVLTASNTYNATTLITAGTLQIGNGTTAGSLNATSSIVNNGSLVFNRTNTVTQGTDFSTAAITGSGSLRQNGAGNLILSNTANAFSGGTIINGGVLELRTTGSTSVILASGSTTSLIGNLAGAGSQITINGGTLRLSPTGTGKIGSATEQEVIRFGSLGGTVYYNGTVLGNNAQFWGFDVSSGPGVVQLDRAIGAAWDAQQSFFLGNNSGASSTERAYGLKGSNNIRFELSNGALLTLGQAGGFTEFSGTLTIKGHPGGNSAANNASVNVGRVGLNDKTDGTGPGNFNFNMNFEDAVQITAFSNPRLINGNISLAANANVTFFGRASSCTTLSQLTLGLGANDILTINNGAQANLDWNVRTDATGYHGVVMNAKANIEAGGTLRLRQTALVGTSPFRSPMKIDGDIVGNGNSTAESLLDIANSVEVATSGSKVIFHATPDGAATALGADLIVNGTGNSGLRVQGNASNLGTAAGALTAARLAAVSGTGGYLTLAVSDGTYVLPASSQWTDSDVGLKVIDSYSSGTDVSLENFAWARDLYIDSGATLNAAGATLGSGTGTGNSSFTNVGGRAAVILRNGTIAGAFSLNANLATEASTASSSINGAVTLTGSRSFIVADGAATTDLTVSGAIDLKANTLTLSGSGNTTISGAISNSTGSGSLVVAAGPTSVIVLTNGANTYNGATTIEVGTLQLGNGGSTGSLSIDSVIANSGTLAFNRTNTVTQGADFSTAAITGTGNLIQAGTGDVILTAANSYTGATRVHAGTLSFLKQNSLYNGGTGNWTLANITVSSGATFAVSAGNSTSGNSPGNFTADDIAIIAALGNATNGFQSGSYLGIDTTYATDGNFTYGTALANPGGNSLGLRKLGTGNLILTAASTYSGTTRIESGSLILSASGSLNPAGTIVNNGTLVFDRSDTLTQNTDFTNSAITGTGGIRQTGAGGTTLNVANTFSGNTTVEEGSLTASVDGALQSTGNVVITGGTLLLNRSTDGNSDIVNNAAGIRLGNSTGTSSLKLGAAIDETVGVLTLSGNSSIDLFNSGSGSVIRFADSSAETWTGTLSIYNWLRSGETNTRVYVSINSGGLTPDQLSKINFYSDEGNDFLGTAGFESGGELTPIPEPGTVAVVLLLGLFLAWRERGTLSVLVFRRRSTRSA
jgi:fibronectin-binding autotransporter adhesin